MLFICQMTLLIGNHISDRSELRPVFEGWVQSNNRLIFQNQFILDYAFSEVASLLDKRRS